MLLYRYSQQLVKSRAHTLYDTFVQVLSKGAWALRWTAWLGKYIDHSGCGNHSDVKWRHPPPQKKSGLVRASSKMFFREVIVFVIHPGSFTVGYTEFFHFLFSTGDVSLSIACQGTSYDTNHCPSSNPQTPGPDSPQPRVGADARWQGVCCQPFCVGQVLIWLETSYSYSSRSLDVGVNHHSLQ